MYLKDKMRLLYVVTKLELGGAQKNVISLIKGLDPMAVEPFLVTARDGALVDEALSIKGLLVHRSAFLDRPVNIFKDVLALIELILFIKRHNIHVVHTHSSKAGILGRIAAWIAGVPGIIHTVHGWSFHSRQGSFFFYMSVMLEQVCAFFTTKIIAVSHCDRDKGLVQRVGSPEKYQVVYCGIRPQDFKVQTDRLALRRELGLTAAEYVVGMVACFKPQKAPLDFIRMAAGVKSQVPGVRFVLVGDGSLRPQVVRAIQQYGLEKDVLLLGWRHDVARVLSVMDVFVLSSSWEGLPVSVLEAMAAGVAVVATDTGGIREAVADGETGYLVPVGDIKSSEERVVRLLQDAELRQRFSRQAMQVVGRKEFSEEHMTLTVQQIYAAAMKG